MIKIVIIKIIDSKNVTINHFNKGKGTPPTRFYYFLIPFIVMHQEKIIKLLESLQ